MKLLCLLLLLCPAFPVTSGQSNKSSATPKPEEGRFVQNTYRNDFFGFSYFLPDEWDRSSVSLAPLLPGTYYLFIGDRHTGHPLMNRVIVMADAESNYRSKRSVLEYLSAMIRSQVSQAKGEVIREASPFVAGENHFDRADYKMVQDQTTLYRSMACTSRNGYWLCWNFVAQSERELNEVVKTLEHISFDRASPR